MLTTLIKNARQNPEEIIDITTSPVDIMNSDRSLSIHWAFFVKGFLYLQSWVRKRKRTQPFLFRVHLGERKLITS